MKKILDIIPPDTQTRREPPKKIEKEKKHYLPKKGLIFLLLILIVLISFSYLSFSEARIKIVPQSELVSFTNELTIKRDLVTQEKEIVETFKATGSTLKKAEGMITVYNEYSTSPQVLIASTRFVSASGKLFRTPEKVTIPGTYYEKGKKVAGSVDIKVIADQPGEEYNIEPTTFSIPGFAGSSKFTFFYAKSFSSMTGGGQVAQVTQEDIDNAEKVLLEKLKKQERDSLTNREGFILLDEAIEQEVIESSPSAPAGTAAERFNYKVRIRSKALIFEKKEIEDSAKNYIFQKIPPDRGLAKNSLKIDYSPENINLDTGEITLNLEFSGKIYQNLDLSLLKKYLANKSFQEASSVLRDQPGIDSFQIELWPFWVRKVPQNPDKIKIELKVD